jgi:hypothetical protein
MVIETFKSEQPCDTSWMENFDSVGWHLVSNEIEREVDIREEELHREESIEELAWCVVFNDFHPNLLLFTVGALDEVIRMAKVHVIRPHAAELVASLACDTIDVFRSL